MTDSRIILALDFPSTREAHDLVARLEPSQCRLKVGFELFVAGGPAFVENLANRGFPVFLDLKFHDIPNTVAAACRSAAALGVWMLNVHAGGGRRMMEAAREAVAAASTQPRLIAVTVLTSMQDEDLAEVGVERPVAGQALGLARLAQNCGLDGVVCSALEASDMRRALGSDFLLVTPGIRPSSGDRGDQRRTATPAAARAAGSDYLVIGRPVTRAPDPAAALDAMNRELAGGVDPC